MQNNMMTLITGGTGKTGRRVAERLARRGLPIRIASRAGQSPFDWNRPESWPPALQGIGAVYIAYSPDLAAPGAQDIIQAFTEQAVRQGVGRFVLLSGRGEAAAQRSEQIVLAARASSTILRADWFNQNFSEDFLADSVRRGQVMLPVGAVPEPFIDADDIADVALAALTDARHAGQVYELSGPRALTFEQATLEIARATGRDIGYQQIPLDAFLSAVAGMGADQAYLDLLRFLFTEVLDGRNASPTDGVQRALGRPPHDFADFARDAAASGCWAPLAA
ncbi:MAG: NmrA family transcriptional regulator [Ferrovibrio sp.]